MSSRFYPNTNGTLTPKVSTWKPRLNIINAKSLGTDSNGDIVDKTKLEHYDATIGIGGDYETVEAMLTAVDNGLSRFKAVGNISNSTNLATKLLISKNIYIDLGDYTLDFGILAMTFTGNPYFTINGKRTGKIFFSNPGGSYISTFYGPVRLIFNNIRIEDKSTSGKFFAHSCYILWENIYFLKSNYSINSICLCSGYINYITFEGVGSNCEGSIATDTAQPRMMIRNIYYTGTWKSNGQILGMLSGKIEKLWYNSSSAVKIIIYELDGVIDTNKKLSIDVYAGGQASNGNCNSLFLRDNSKVQNISAEYFNTSTATTNTSYINCTFNQATTTQNLAYTKMRFFNCVFKGNFTCYGNYFSFLLCDFQANLTIDGDYGKIKESTVSGTLTLNTGSEKNIITGNHIAALTDNSGNTTNEYNNNIII